MVKSMHIMMVKSPELPCRERFKGNPCVRIILRNYFTLEMAHIKGENLLICEKFGLH